MRTLLATFLVAGLAAPGLTQPSSSTTTIKARAVIDGKGATVIANGMVTVRDGKIVAVGPASGSPSPTTWATSTLLPGFIDTHVHIGWHFGPDGRFSAGPEPADTAALYGAENAYVTLMAGFTTVQSVGAASDKALRDAIARGIMPGPRLLSSLGQISERPKLTPDQLRDDVRKKKADGADLDQDLRLGQHPRRRRADPVAGAARRGVRRSARPRGCGRWCTRTRAEAMMRAARAGCTVVEHGGLATAEALAHARRQGRLVRPEHRPRHRRTTSRTRRKYLGIGNYNEEGFAFMEKALGSKDAMFGAALKTQGPEDGRWAPTRWPARTARTCARSSSA